MQTETVIMPRAITAENGAKGFMSGEFFEEIEHSCHECCDEDEDVQANCELCEGAGYHIQKVPVSWDTIKAIYAKAVQELGV